MSSRAGQRWLGWLVGSGALAVSLAAPAVAFAQAVDKAACVAAYEQGQQLRKDGALRAAKREFSVCADVACPDVTKGDCTTWSSEVDKSLPTISFVVKNERGDDLSEVRVSVDGALLVASLKGAAVEVDPGAHTFRFEVSGAPPVELSVVVREGEKNRALSVVVSAAGSSAAPGISPATWVLAGAGAAGMAVFAVAGGLGLAEKADAEATCSPRCSAEVIDPIQTKFIAADIGLALGLSSLAAALVVGLVTGLDDGAPAKAPAAAAWLPVPGGGVALVAVPF